MERKTILLAEGKPHLRQFRVGALEREGYRVVPASTCEEALARVRSEKPDLVVMDLRLPSEGGLETLNRILEDAEAPPVILTSSSPIWDEGFLTWNAEACLSIEHPFDLRELKEAIEATLARRAARARGARAAIRALTAPIPRELMRAPPRAGTLLVTGGREVKP